MSTIQEVLEICEESMERGDADCLIRQLIPCFWGDTGVGKTQQIVMWGRDHDYHVCIVHVGSMESPADLIGMPDRNPDTGKTEYLLPDWFDFNHSRVLILFDEINRGNTLLQQALFPVLGDYMVGPHKIPKNVMMVAAANPPLEEFNVTELDAALINRMWHVPIIPKVEEWVEWAVEKIHTDIVDFVDFHETTQGVTRHVIQMGASAGQKAHTKVKSILPKLTPTGKSWEMVSLVYRPDLPKSLCKLLFDGLLGPGIYELFVPFQMDKERPLRPSDILERYSQVQGTILAWGSVQRNRPDLLDITLQRLSRVIHGAGKRMFWALPYVNRSTTLGDGFLSPRNRVNQSFDFLSEHHKESQLNFLNFLGDLSRENRRSLKTLLLNGGEG